MQIPLLQPDPLTPLPVDAGQYVAALQNKPGELDALRHASAETWERLTPLVQFVGPKKRDEPFNASTIRDWVAKVASAVGAHPVYLDVMRLDPMFKVHTTGADVPVLQQIFVEARKRALGFVPVAWVGERTAGHRKLVAGAALEDGHGLALRYRLRAVVPPAGTTVTKFLADQLASMNCEVASADLLVDLEYIDPDVELHPDDIAAMLRQMLDVGPWRSIVLLGTSMPKMLSCIAEGSVGSLPRREWELWTGLQSCDLPRMPAFGDYAIQYPHPPMDGGGPGMRANIRYTANGDTLVARGQGSVIQEGKEQYRLLCQQLVARAEFAGSDYTWGDGVIEDCARGTVAPGAQNVWRGAGTSHHLRLVTEQLRQQPAAA